MGFGARPGNVVHGAARIAGRMIRANLLPRQSTTVTVFGVGMDLEVLRRTLSVVVTIVTFVTCTVAIQFFRVHRLVDEAVFVESLLAANEVPRRSLSELEMQVTVLRHIERAGRIARHSGNDAASGFAVIGNSIPPSAWLDGIVREPDGYVISGTARTIVAVGDTFDSLSRTQRLAHISLVNVVRDAQRKTVHFTIRLSTAAAGAR